MTDSVTYAGAWAKTVSPESQWLVQSVVVISPIVSCLASSIVLTDILGLVLLKLGMPSSVYGNRNVVIGILSSCVLYPLCILKDLSALKSVSVLGVAGHLVAMGALALRIMDKSYFQGGKFFAPAAAAATASAGAVTQAAKAGLSKWFVLASLLSYCFVTHYNVSTHDDDDIQWQMRMRVTANNDSESEGGVLVTPHLYTAHTPSSATDSLYSLN